MTGTMPAATALPDGEAPRGLCDRQAPLRCAAGRTRETRGARPALRSGPRNIGGPPPFRPAGVSAMDRPPYDAAAQPGWT